MKAVRQKEYIPTRCRLHFVTTTCPSRPGLTDPRETQTQDLRLCVLSGILYTVQYTALSSQEVPLRPELVLDHVNAERILDEGWIMFQQKGYLGVSLDALCARCGLTKPTLYYYFRNKENLFVQVLRHRLSGFHKAIEAPGSLTERLERTALAILESFQTEYSALLRDREHIADAANRERIREAFRAELFDPLAGLMQAGIDAGELQPEKADVLVVLFLGMLNSAIGRAAETGADRHAFAKLVTHYFLHGAAAGSR